MSDEDTDDLIRYQAPRAAATTPDVRIIRLCLGSLHFVLTTDLKPATLQEMRLDVRTARPTLAAADVQLSSSHNSHPSSRQKLERVCCLTSP